MNGLEALKAIRPCANVCGDYDPYCDIIEKELKALEIIKKSISSATSLDTLLRELLFNGKINQEEFFLLREVFK